MLWALEQGLEAHEYMGGRYEKNTMGEKNIISFSLALSLVSETGMVTRMHPWLSF